MATRISSRIENDSSGIYFTETDLTTISQVVGGFSAGAIGLTEKGPAFEIIKSTSFENRIKRMGNLNLNFPSSYYAKQFLEQSNDYKELRLLGLEGYKDTKAWAVSLNLPGNAMAVLNTTPLTLTPNSLMAVLKERPTSLTGRAAITNVFVSASTYNHPVTGLVVTSASDYLFNIIIEYADLTTEIIACSLRPESKDYILNKFWDKPFKKNKKGDVTFPLFKNKIIPLWIDFISPSVKTLPTGTTTRGYYLPGSTTAQYTLPLLIGNMLFGSGLPYGSSFPVTSVSAITEEIRSEHSETLVIVGTKITVTGNLTTGFPTGKRYVTLSNISSTTVGSNMSTINGRFEAINMTFAAGNTEFEIGVFDRRNTSTFQRIVLKDYNGLSLLAPTPSASRSLPAWEDEVLDFSDVGFTTPVTPWFVSDGDANGEVINLFRLHSISDGVAANTEIKVEIRNLNPTAYNGKGSFDLVIREFNDREDLEEKRYETFSNLTLDSNSDNYILRRIGDGGEEYKSRSSFVLCEINKEVEIPNNVLPYGVQGYPNVTSKVLNPIEWTTAYDKTKSLSKQTLGLPNNNINTNKPIVKSQLKYIANFNGEKNKGFHLNPLNNSKLVTEQSANYIFAESSVFTSSTNGIITPSEKVKRSRFAVAFYGGFDGWNEYSERTWSDTTSKDYQALASGIKLLSDKENINSDFTVLVTPDIFIDKDSTAVESVLEMVEKRGDCMYIPDLKYSELSDPQEAADLILNSNIRSNASAVYFPWIQIKDTFNNSNIWLPPSLLALGTITYTAQSENFWQPPGGPLRTVTNNLLQTRKRMMLEDREILKSASINPITVFPGSGYEITEVRTTQEVFSALSFIHNRLLLCYAKKILNQTLRPLLFNLRGDLTEIAFLNTVTPIFERIKKLNGIEDFKVEIVNSDLSDDRTTLYGKITIVPLYPVERIVVNFTTTDTIEFND